MHSLLITKRGERYQLESEPGSVADKLDFTRITRLEDETRIRNGGPNYKAPALCRLTTTGGRGDIYIDPTEVSSVQPLF